MNRQFQASPGGRPLRGLFVSGTGTDVGKTVALAALLRACLKADLRVRPVKPVQTGVSGPDDARGDATVYAAAIAGLSNAVAPATLRRFVMPASPHLAAGREGVHLDVESLRAAVLRHYQELSCSFLNLVHPKAYVCPSAVMGEANIIQRDSTIYCNARIGNGNYLNGAVNIAHDAVIGDCNFLGPYSMVLGGASIGDGNHLGPRTLILEKQRAGSHNLCAPDSVLYKGCGDHCRMAGSPAIKIGTYPDPEFS